MMAERLSQAAMPLKVRKLVELVMTLAIREAEEDMRSEDNEIAISNEIMHNRGEQPCQHN